MAQFPFRNNYVFDIKINKYRFGFLFVRFAVSLNGPLTISLYRATHDNNYVGSQGRGFTIKNAVFYRQHFYNKTIYLRVTRSGWFDCHAKNLRVKCCRFLVDSSPRVVFANECFMQDVYARAYLVIFFGGRGLRHFFQVKFLNSKKWNNNVVQCW